MMLIHSIALFLLAGLVHADEGFLGLVLAPVSPGVVGVSGLASGASAQKAGVKEGDVILKYQGAEVHTSAELIDAVKKTAPGQMATLVVKRGSKEVPFEILIVSRKDFLGEQIEALKGKKAPELVGINAVSGKKIAVSQFLGKPLVIALWATWCPACLHGVPKLNELAAKNKGNLGIMAVSFENRAAIKKFAARVPVSYDLVATDTNNMSLGYMNNTSIPKYLLVDAKGTVVNVYQSVDDVGQALRGL